MKTLTVSVNTPEGSLPSKLCSLSCFSEAVYPLYYFIYLYKIFHDNRSKRAEENTMFHLVYSILYNRLFHLFLLKSSCIHLKHVIQAEIETSGQEKYGV